MITVSTEEIISKEIQGNLVGAAEDGLELVGATKNMTSAKVVEAINKYVTGCAREKVEVSDVYDEMILSIGSLWGQQMVKEFKWEWSSVEFSDKSAAYGVFHKNRSLALYPFHFIYGCIVNQAQVKIALSFNMLLAGEVPKFKPREYGNVMDCFHFIVPP